MVQQPVAQPMQQPMQQPVAAAARPAQMPRMVSMRHLPTSAAQAPAATQQSLPEMNEPVADDALRRAWRHYTNTVPSEKLLVNLMLNCAPQLVQGTQYQISVVGDAQRNILEPHLPTISRYLQSEMHNTHISLSVLVQAPDSTARRAFSPREKFNEMKQSNPEAISNLIDKFGLELA